MLVRRKANTENCVGPREERWPACVVRVEGLGSRVQDLKFCSGLARREDDTEDTCRCFLVFRNQNLSYEVSLTLRMLRDTLRLHGWAFGH